MNKESSMAEENHSYEKQYSDKGFWGKVVAFARIAGKEVIEKALWLYYAAQQPQTPAWAKATMYSALGYFILPLDAIPDFIPAAGFTDDLGVLIAAVATVALYVTDDVKALAAQKLESWFG